MQGYVTPTTAEAKRGKEGEISPEKVSWAKKGERERGIGGEFARNYDFPETEQSQEKWGAERERKSG